MNGAKIYRWAVFSAILIIVSQLYVGFNAFAKNEILITLYLILSYAGPLAYVYLVDKSANKRYYLIPILLVVLNIIFLFISHVFVRVIYNVGTIFIISSAILVLSTVIIGIINYQKSTFPKTEKQS